MPGDKVTETGWPSIFIVLNISCYFLAHGHPGHILGRIALQMALTAVPLNTGKAGKESIFQAGMIVADRVFNPGDPPFLKARQEFPPVDFSFTERDTDSQYRSLPLR